MAMPQMGGAKVQVMRRGRVRNLAIAGSSARTPEQVEKERHVVRIVATQDCYWLDGDENVEVSAATGVWLPAGMVELWQVVPNATYLAVIQDGTPGNLNIVECY